MNPAIIAAAAVAAGLIIAGKLVYDYLTAADGSNGLSAKPNKNAVSGCAKRDSISPQEAQQLMNDFAAQKDQIPFDYPPDCCYARARVMCDQMEKQGVPCEKYWYGYDKNGVGMVPSTPEKGPVYLPPLPNPAAKQVIWRYHVAPLVPVKQPDGTVTKMVLDPSLSDTPLTQEEWRRRAGVVPNPTEMTSDSNWVPWGNNKQTVDEAEDALADHRKARKDGLAP